MSPRLQKSLLMDQGTLIRLNPLQPLALILGNACASHQTLKLCSLATEGTQEPACGKLCLSITTIGS